MASRIQELLHMLDAVDVQDEVVGLKIAHRLPCHVGKALQAPTLFLTMSPISLSHRNFYY